MAPSAMRRERPLARDGSLDCLGHAESDKLHLYGNFVEWDQDTERYKYSDGTEVSMENLRPCPVCGGDPRDHDMCDPCLGRLPGVKKACCGHGMKPGHIKFVSGVKIEGEFKVSHFDTD